MGILHSPVRVQNGLQKRITGFIRVQEGLEKGLHKAPTKAPSGFKRREP